MMFRKKSTNKRLTHAGWSLFETLENRHFLSVSAFELIGLNALRSHPDFDDIDGSGVSVAIIDSAIDTSHRNLTGNVVATYDFVNDSSDLVVDSEHGSHVGGIVGANDPSIGVAPKANLISLDVMQPYGNTQTATIDDIEEALQWVINHAERHNIVAVNMSLGAGAFVSPLAPIDRLIIGDEIRKLENMNVTVVSAAGNSYVEFGMQENSGTPGIISTLNVGAVYDSQADHPITSSFDTTDGRSFFYGDSDSAEDRIAVFSQRPPGELNNSIFAPGVNILSTVPGEKELAFLDGTSMAAPMVSGTVALMQQTAFREVGRYLAPNVIRSILLETSDLIIDGDDEESYLFEVDSENNATEHQFKFTGNQYPRVNAFRAVRGVEMHLENIKDADSTIATANLGPTLSGVIELTVDPRNPPNNLRLGSIGKDGDRTIGTNDVDMYRFEVQGEGNVTLDLASPIDQLDSYLRLFDENGQELAADDDSGVGFGSRITHQLKSGNYYVGVTSSGNFEFDPTKEGNAIGGINEGSYELSFNFDFFDADGTLENAIPLDISQGVVEYEARIGMDGEATNEQPDVDFVTFVAPDSGIVQFDIDSIRKAYQNASRAEFDTLVRVFDENGEEMARNDDGLHVHIVDSSEDECPSRENFVVSGIWCDLAITRSAPVDGRDEDSFIRFDVESGERYYVGVSTAANGEYDPNSLENRNGRDSRSPYWVTLEFTNRDFDGSINEIAFSRVAELQLDETIRGVDTIGSDAWEPDLNIFDLDEDVDLVQVKIQNDGFLKIKTTSHDDPLIFNKVDTSISIFDVDGNRVGSATNMPGEDSELIYTVALGETFFVGFSGKGNELYDIRRTGSGSVGDFGQYSYELTLSSTSEAGNDSHDSPGVKSIMMGAPVFETLGQDGPLDRPINDIDYFRFEPEATGTYSISTTSALENAVDTILHVQDDDLNVIAGNDDARIGILTSQVTVDLEQGETYFLRVAGARANTFGAYALQVDIESSEPCAFGDVNDDCIFNSTDLIAVFQAGEYEDEIDGNSTHEEGDWNGDGDFDSSDLVFVFQNGNYSQAARINSVHAAIDSIFDQESPYHGADKINLRSDEVLDLDFVESLAN